MEIQVIQIALLERDHIDVCYGWNTFLFCFVLFLNVELRLFSESH